MADAEAKPVVEFTKVLLSHITTTRFFFLKDAAMMLLFFLPSLSRVCDDEAATLTRRR
jgi:hypothetical protein